MNIPLAPMTTSPGFADSERVAAARLYWAAFGQKLGHVLGPEPRALAYLAETLDPAFALVARDAGGVMLGFAGFKTAKGSLVAGGLRDLIRHYGYLGSAWRVLLLAVLKRELRQGVFLMDGLCVATEARGRGAGTLLLNAIKDYAVALGCATVRLDVIDTNPRARALYERQGFQPTKTVRLGPLRHVFGFNAATTMIWTAS